VRSRLTPHPSTLLEVTLSSRFTVSDTHLYGLPMGDWRMKMDALS
jgi:hypothetical protein